MLAILASALLMADLPADDLKAMEGTWAVKSMEQQGKAYPGELLLSVRLQVDGDRFVFTRGSLQTRDKSTFTTRASGPSPSADNSASGPRPIDLTREPDGQVVKGIYKVEDGLLTICTASRGDRPADFAAPKGSGNILTVYRRPEFRK